MADISTVIILHQDAEFSLIKFQKSLVNYLNAFLHKNGFHSNLFYSPYPLWLPLPDESFHAENKSQLKEIEKKIINLTLNDFISINKGSVFLDFIIQKLRRYAIVYPAVEFQYCAVFLLWEHGFTGITL